jgi:hypothetical protein
MGALLSSAPLGRSFEESMERVGRSTAPDRELFIIELEDLQSFQIEQERLEGSRFVCFWVGDFTQLDCGEIARFARQCIEMGAVYFSIWGPGCSRAHDCIDLACDLDETYETMIPTTWHDNEPLYEALYDSIFNAFPADTYFEDCSAVVALVLDNVTWAAELRKWMNKPESLQARVLSEFESGSA